MIVVPVGVTAQTSEEQRKMLICKAEEITDLLVSVGIRAESDLRDNYSPGWKFNHWELKGVPVRVEVGPRDVANNQVLLAFAFSVISHPWMNW